MMTRRDFENVAGVLFEQTTHDEAGHQCGALSDDAYALKRQTTQQIAGCLAFAFATENPRFDRARFLRACGVSE